MYSSRMAALVALVVIVVLGLRSQIRNGDEDARILDDLRVLRELDARLGRSVLQAQDGLSQSYDDLSATVVAMQARHRTIEVAVAAIGEPASIAAAGALGRDLGARTELVDTFESRNSMVRNSLAYLERSTRRAAAMRGGSEDDELARRCVLLLASTIDNENNHDASALASIRRETEGLEVLRASYHGPNAAVLDAVLLHARLYTTEAPQLDHAVEVLLTGGGLAVAELQRLTEARRARSTRTANLYRIALVTVCLALLGAIAVVLRRLRRKKGELALLNQNLEVRVTERTKDLAASREQYRELLESTQAIPWVMEPGSLRFAYVGPQATRLLGFPPEAWQEEGFLAGHLHPDDIDATLLALRSDSANDHEIEVRMFAADGRCLTLRSFVSTTLDEEDRIVRRGILLDVTARRTLEGKLAIAHKLESVGRLAAGVAHEINTPVQFVSDNVHFTQDALATVMRVVARYGALLEDDRLTRDERAAAAAAAREEEDLDYVIEEAPRALEGTIQGLGRIATIVRSLGDFSHPDTPQMAAADLNASLESTLTVARSEYRDVADVVLDLAELPPVVCHVGQISQVILNLAVNAAQAIAGHPQEGERGRITVRSRWDGASVVVSISDTGGGIPDQVKNRIFDPFFTTKPVGQGTGQGLAIARTIVVDTHHGDLSFETELGRGTTFHVRLPAAAGAAHAAAS
ncbi:MAG: sensor histidine kinase [Labilithrix sp.]|nr:sensor histidine kinase [Labilithrix sp.]